MGCNCKGSTARVEQQRAQRAQQKPREVNGGGPGEPGYTWNGPARKPVEKK